MKKLDIDMILSVYAIVVGISMILIGVKAHKSCTTLPKAVKTCIDLSIAMGVILLVMGILFAMLQYKKFPKKHLAWLCMGIVAAGLVGMILNVVILSRKGAMITMCGLDVSKSVCDLAFVSLALSGILVVGIQYTIHKKLKI